MSWDVGEVRPLAVEALGERYRRYRLADPAAEEAMARSLRQYGQASPVVVCVRDGQPELLDGFKRRAAAALAGVTDARVPAWSRPTRRRPRRRSTDSTAWARSRASWRKRGSCMPWCVRTA